MNSYDDFSVSFLHSSLTEKRKVEILEKAVANNIKGTIALPHSYGRLQFGADLDLHFRTMIGTGKNPNVAAVIVIGIEPKWTKRIVDEIAKTGKPVEGFHIERTGDIGTIMKASKKAQEYP